MSISGPASSRWSAPVFVASPTSRSVVSSSAALGSGGFGSEASARSSSASTPPSSSPSALARRETSCISAIAALASSPAFLARPIPCEASFWRARSASTSGSSSSRRASSRSASSRRASDPSRRRASAARTGSGSRRIAFRSSIARGGLLRVWGLLGARRRVRRRLLGPGRLAAGVLREELRDLLRVLARDDVLRHRARREAAVLDGVQHVVGALGALVEVRAVLVLAGLDLRGRPLRPHRGERVAARAVHLEQLRALALRIVLRQRVALLPAARDGERDNAHAKRDGPGEAGEAHERRTAYGTIPPLHAPPTPNSRCARRARRARGAGRRGVRGRLAGRACARRAGDDHPRRLLDRSAAD